MVGASGFEPPTPRPPVQGLPEILRQNAPSPEFNATSNCADGGEGTAGDSGADTVALALADALLLRAIGLALAAVALTITIEVGLLA